MASKKNLYDFNVGLLTVAISAHEAQEQGSYNPKELREGEKIFRGILADAVKQRISDLKLTQFPTQGPVFIFMLQCFASEALYKRKDVDNMAKSTLDALEGIVYEDDGQVKTLLVTKKVQDSRIPTDFLYIAVKEQREDADVNAVKVTGVEQAFQLYKELAS